MKRQRLKHGNYSELSRRGSDSEEETELFVRKPDPYKEIPTVEKLIEEGDTLQSISIQYQCTIGELKRLNNIHKENEIYARNIIKVPAKSISAALAGVHTSGKSSPNNDTLPNTETTSIVKLQTSLESLKHVPSGVSNDVNSVIFNSSIIKVCDIESDITHNVENTADEEEITLLPNTVPVVEKNCIISKLSCNGIDGDISWVTLVICVLIMCIVIPLIYVLYIAEHLEQYHKHLNGTITKWF